MEDYLHELADLVSPSLAGWRKFFAKLTASRDRLLSDVSHSVHAMDRATLMQATVLASRDSVPGVLSKAFGVANFADDYVDTDILQQSLVGVFATATLATFAPRSADLSALTIWLSDLEASFIRGGNGADAGMSHHARIALKAVMARGGGAATVLHWLRYWLRVPSKGPVTRVPVAYVVDSAGAIAHLYLTPVPVGGTSPELIIDLPTSLIPCRRDFIKTLASAAPPDLTTSISWHIDVPRGTGIVPLEGDSIGGPAKAAVHLLNSGLTWHASTLLIGKFSQEQKLQPVGEEDLKLEAACNSFEQNYNSHDAAIAARGIQRVFLSERSLVSLDGYLDRGISIERVATLADIESSLSSALAERKEVYKIKRSLRTLTARPDNDTPDAAFGGQGEPLFSMRMDYSHALTFDRSNRKSTICTIHYSTEAPGGRIVGSADPPEENIWGTVEAGALAAYRRDHRRYGFSFTPRPGRTYQLSAQVRRGFEEEHRRLHAHIWTNADHETVEVCLDFRAYLAHDYAGRERMRTDLHPVLYFWRWRDPATLSSGDTSTGVCPVCTDCDDIKDLLNVHPVPESLHRVLESGYWTWDVGGVEFGGAILVSWEHLFAQPPAPTAT